VGGYTYVHVTLVLDVVGGYTYVRIASTNYYPSVLFDTVGWVIWPIKIVPDMTYNVFGGTLNLTLPTYLCTCKISSQQYPNICVRRTLDNWWEWWSIGHVLYWVFVVIAVCDGRHRRPYDCWLVRLVHVELCTAFAHWADIMAEYDFHCEAPQCTLNWV